MSAFMFILMALACWRITHLFAKEDGPFNLIYHMRKKAGAGFFGSLLDCFYCISIWVAFPFGMYFGSDWFEKLLSWWALSGAACLMEQATNIKNNKDSDLPDYKED